MDNLLIAAFPRRRSVKTSKAALEQFREIAPDLGINGIVKDKQ
jgi:hypothetical protein